MSDTIYKKIEIVGVSKQSFSDAVANAIARTAKTVKDLRWFEVIEQRGSIVDGKVDEYQATVKIGFRVKE